MQPHLNSTQPSLLQLLNTSNTSIFHFFSFFSLSPCLSVRTSFFMFSTYWRDKLPAAYCNCSLPIFLLSCQFIHLSTWARTKDKRLRRFRLRKNFETSNFSTKETQQTVFHLMNRFHTFNLIASESKLQCTTLNCRTTAGFFSSTSKLKTSQLNSISIWKLKKNQDVAVVVFVIANVPLSITMQVVTSRNRLQIYDIILPLGQDDESGWRLCNRNVPSSYSTDHTVYVLSCV